MVPLRVSEDKQLARYGKYLVGRALSDSALGGQR